jgi:hypothetical protein
VSSLLQGKKAATIYGSNYLQGVNSRFLSLVARFKLMTTLLMKCHYCLFLDVTTEHVFITTELQVKRMLTRTTVKAHKRSCQPGDFELKIIDL